MKYHRPTAKLALACLLFLVAALGPTPTLAGHRVEAHDLGNLRLVYGAMGDLPKAIEHLQQGLAIFEAIGMPRDAEIARSNITKHKEATAGQDG